MAMCSKGDNRKIASMRGIINVRRVDCVRGECNNRQIVAFAMAMCGKGDNG